MSPTSDDEKAPQHIAKRKKRQPVERQPSAAPEPEPTCHQVLEEAILELFDLGRENGMTEDHIDEVMSKIMEDRSAILRRGFKVLDGETSP